MDISQYFKVLSLAERLKNTTRHSWTSQGRHESVAEHSWRLALMAYFLRDEFPEADMDKVIQMCLVHDLGEAFTGDIATFWKTAANEDSERQLLEGWVASLPQPYQTELGTLYAEMDAQETVEARIYKSLDKLEAVHQHNEAPLNTWLPLERELNLSYGADVASFSPYLSALRSRMRQETEAKLRAETASGDVWDTLYHAARAVQNSRQVSPLVDAGGVAAAVLSRKGNIYTGVCVDTASTLGICAERNAIFQMLTQGEHQIDRVVAVMPDGRVGPPCGACRELMMQLDPDAGQIEILLRYPEKKSVTLGELTPCWWGGECLAGQGE